MRKIKYVVLTFLFASSIFSCDNVDFGDTNENKNGAIEPATSGLLSGAIMSYATFTGRTGVTIPTLLVQYQSQVTYTDEMLYAQTPYSWTTYYQAVLFPLSEIIRINSDPANHTAELLQQGDVEDQIGVATIMRAIVMKRVTDVYGDAPYTAAFQGLDEITPEYETQENIYKGLISEVKAARDMITTAGTAFKGDILYNGDLSKWRKLANSLILQMTLQLSKKYPTPAGYAGTEFNAALTNTYGVIDDVSATAGLNEEAWFSYADLAGFRSPWFANRTADYFLSAEFVNAMNGCATCPTVSGVATVNPTTNRTADTRKLVYVKHDHQARNGVPYGYNDMSGSSRAQMATRYYWNATASIPLMTASYTYLNRAEGAALGWSAEDATVMLTNGILKSFESLQLKAIKETPSTATAPVLDGPTYATARVAQIGVTATLAQVIAEEKWKSLFGQAYDAWAEWRRTGIPTLVAATDSYNGDVIPRRFQYPGEEPSLNGANYDAAVSRLTPGEDKNIAKVWWDQ